MIFLLYSGYKYIIIQNARMEEGDFVIVYCKEDVHSMHVVMANLIASQILKKPDSVFGMIGFFEKHDEVTSILKKWTAAGYINFSKASMVQYDDRESYLSQVDLLLYGISEQTGKSRRYECYQAFQNAERVLVVAQGKEHSSKVKYVFEECVLSENPVAILQEHKDVILVGDKLALGEIKRDGQWYY